MKRFVFLILTLFFLLLTPVKAELSWGTERDVCFKQEKTISEAYNCLSKSNDNIGRQLDALIFETEKRIKANNIGSFNGKGEANKTYGDVYSRRFLQAQEKWKEYRHELCLAVATEINEDAWDYQSYRDQCEINLNKRHIEEINLMGLPPVN